MICHAKRIAENRRIDEMERKSMPLVIMISVCFITLAISSLYDFYENHESTKQTADIFAQCLSGVTIQADNNGLIVCSFKKSELIGGFK
jgi:hypothetical protein